MQTPFELKDCALVAKATGTSARSVRELVHHVRDVSPNSLHHHFWASRLQPKFDDPEYRNDFASWAHRELHDTMLSERLGILDPLVYATLEDLRHGVVEVLEERLAADEEPPSARPGHEFHFMESQIVVFGTRQAADTPYALRQLLPTLSAGSVYYHFIDGRRRRSDGLDDFRAWLGTFGEETRELCARVASVDPYFRSLTELRDRLVAVFDGQVGT